MIVIDLKNDKDFKRFSDGTFPVFFIEDYARCLNNFGEKLFLFYSEHFNAAMPVKIWRSKFLNLATCLFQPLSEGAPLSPEKEKQFLEEFVSYVSQKNLCHRITAPSNTAVFQSAPDESVSAPFGTYKRKLAPLSIDEVIASFQPRFRTAVRQSKREGVEIKYGKKVLNDFYKIFKETLDRSSMNVYDKSYFEYYLESLPRNTLMSVAYQGKDPVGCLFIVFSKHSAQYLHGGSSGIASGGAIKHLHADAMEHLISLGVKEYDFVGARIQKITDSKLLGIQRFKSHFGTTLVKGIIWKKDLKTFYCRIFDVLLKIKLKMRGNSATLDIVDQERALKRLISGTVTSEKSKHKRILKFLTRLFVKKITKSQLKKQLSDAGISEGDTLLIHSSFNKLGNIAGGPVTVIEALTETVSEKGNISMPSFTYLNRMIDTAISDNYVFDVDKTPSVTGIITEVFRLRENVLRSVHPTHSFIAYGPSAADIVNGHFTAQTNFGAGTPFDIISSMNGKVMGLGIGVGHITIYHMLEDFFPEDFKGVYFPEPFKMKVKVNGQINVMSVMVHDPKFSNNRIDKNPQIEKWFDNYLEKKGILHKHEFGSGMMWWMDMNTLLNELKLLKDRGITIYKVPVGNDV